MKATPQELGNDLREALGTDKPTAKQLWAITKFAKYVRLRARNNSAFNNLMNAAFPHAKFRQVTKFKKDGSSYPGLDIIVDNEAYSPAEEDDV